MTTKTAPKTLKTIQRFLPVKLTLDEVRGAGEELAGITQDIVTEEKRQEDLKAQMKARLTELKSKQQVIAIKVGPQGRRPQCRC